MVRFALTPVIILGYLFGTAINRISDYLYKKAQLIVNYG